MRILLALLLVLPAVQAVEVLGDNPGDVVVEIQGTSQPAGDAYAYLDLVGLTVDETADAFVFAIQVADIKPASEETSEGGVIEVWFRHHDTEFRLEVGRGVFFGEFLFANLFAKGEGGWGHVWGTQEITADTNTETYSLAVPRVQLADQGGAPPFPGRVLNEFRADSYSFLSEAGIGFNGNDPVNVPARVGDRMPDDGVGAQEIVVAMGIEQTGSARLTSDEPRRASNGEASTFVYRVNATNIGDSEALYTLSTKGVPSNWAVSMPEPAVLLGPQESREVPVILSTPFAHQHGSFQTFILEMTDVDDAGSVGRIELGITYLEIPQPAGHHDTVYFHSRSTGGFALPVELPFGGAQAYMNAAESHSGDAGVDVRAWNWGVNVRGDTTLSMYRWYVPLDPGLQMGLDFDMSRTGTLVVPVHTTAPQPGATLVGNLVLARDEDAWNSDARVAVLGSFQSDAVDLGPDSSHTFELEVTLHKAADLVPYKAGQNLVLELMFNSTKPPSLTNVDAPVLQPGGSLRLPMYEYKDPVAGTFGDSVRLTAPDTSLMRNPGSTALFRTTLNGPPGAYELRLVGVHADWATLGKPAVTLKDGGTTIDVVVRVPSDALDGDRADLVLQATGKDGAALLRLVVDVDTDAEHPDDAGAVSGTDEKKAPGLVLPVLGLALLVLARRRR